MTDRMADWMRDLEAGYLADLTFAEVARALRALSSSYVERRDRLQEGGALAGAGKRAAFALFYGPLHFLLVRHILDAVSDPERRTSRLVVDLGCGTGAAGAAWADVFATQAVLGIDRHGWALPEAARTYRRFAREARTRRADLSKAAWPDGADCVAAFALNELPDPSRAAALRRLVDRGRRGAAVLVVEPIAGFVAPWWTAARRELERIGGRADEWRVRLQLPEIVMKLDRAAGLDHRELTGRSLWVQGSG